MLNELDPVELKFEAPGRPLSINQANRMHWAAKRRQLEPWRDATSLAWKAARPYWWKVQGKKIKVECFLPFPDSRRRDPHNYVGTIVKAMIDALTTKTEKVGKREIVVWEGCWPDDTPEYVEVVEPKLIVGTECRVLLHPQLRFPVPNWVLEDPE